MVPKLAMLWVLLYTTGLTPGQKSRRRFEIASDMHEQRTFAMTAVHGSRGVSSAVASRTVRGMLADILWRLEAGRDGESQVRLGVDPPLPWFTMWFVSAVIVAGGVASTQVAMLGDVRVMLAFLAALGAGLLWLGLHLATHRFFGPLCIATGSIAIAGGLWWTLAGPVVAVGFGISGLRRAQRLEAALDAR